MRKRSGLALAGAVMLGLAPAHFVRAQSEAATTDVARAEAQAADAYEAYARKDYARAVTLYQQALEASPSPDIVYNIARIYDTKLKDRTLAIEYYARYQADPGAEVDRLRTADERLVMLRELETVAAEPVPRRAAASSGSQGTNPVVPVAAEPLEPSGLSAVQVAGIFIGTAGVAGLSVGAGFGLAAKDDADETHDLCDGNACLNQRGVDAAKSASRQATIATIAFIAGGALLLGGASMLVFGVHDRPEREHATLYFTPYAAHEGAGAMLAGLW